MREKLMSIGDDFWIENGQGQRAYKVNGKALHFRDTFVLEDVSGAEVARIQERKLSIRDKVAIERGGDTAATVQKALIGIRDRFAIDVKGGADMKAHGNLVDHEYKIERDGDTVATISRKWFRVRDSYGVDITAGEDVPLILAITVAIDSMTTRVNRTVRTSRAGRKAVDGGEPGRSGWPGAIYGILDTFSGGTGGGNGAKKTNAEKANAGKTNAGQTNRFPSRRGLPGTPRIRHRQRVCGVLVAGLVVPGIAAAGVAGRNSITFFNQLPSALTVDPPSQSTKVLTADGKLIATFYAENRVKVGLDQMSPYIKDAIVAVEDRRFYEHAGVDPQGILRALSTNLSGGGRQGASTLTQQYVANVVTESLVSADRGDEVIRSGQKNCRRQAAGDEARHRTGEEVHQGPDPGGLPQHRVLQPGRLRH